MSDHHHISIPKINRPGDKVGPGWWIFDGEVRIVCGGCKKDGGALADHTIEADGRVHASLLCDCGWHVFGMLIDWSYGKKEPGSARVSDGD